MLWKLLRVLVVLAILTGLAIGGYRFLAQKTAQSNVTNADRTACHTFIKWDRAAHNNQVDQQTFNQMLVDLSHVSDGALKKDTLLLVNAANAQNVNGLQKQVLAIAYRCNYLGLIDRNGNPT